MRWIIRWINRLWFCRRKGHIWSNDAIEFWISDFHGIKLTCVACGHEQLSIDFEATSIRPYTLDN